MVCKAAMWASTDARSRPMVLIEAWDAARCARRVDAVGDEIEVTFERHAAFDAQRLGITSRSDRGSGDCRGDPPRTPAPGRR